MKIICAWCEVNMGEKEPLEDKRISHGICKVCLKKQFAGKKLVASGLRNRNGSDKFKADFSSINLGLKSFEEYKQEQSFKRASASYNSI